MRWAAALFLLGVVSRLWFAYDAGELRDDARYRYVEIARNLSEGNGFRIRNRETAHAMPLWPVVLSFWPAGWKPQYLNALLSIAALPLAWALARRLGGRKVALLALGLLAFDLDTASGAGSLLTEPLFTVTLLLFSLAWVHQRSLAAAALLGLATLVRPEIFLLPAFLAPFGWKRSLLLLAGVLVCLTPWVVRNAAVFDAFVPFTTTGGVTLHAGMNEAEEKLDFRRKGQGRALEFRHAWQFVDEADELSYDVHHKHEAIRYAREHPGRALELTAAKAMLLWTPIQRKGRSFVYALATLLCWWAVRKRVKFPVPLVLPMLVLMTFIGLVFAAMPRLHAPYHPYVFLLAAGGLVATQSSNSPAVSTRSP